MLYGAYARIDSDAWAVGRQFGPSGQPAPPPVTYHWNGSAWSLVPTPASPAVASLVAVGAASGSDAWAVGWTAAGSSHRALAEHWDSARWTVVPGPSSSARLFALRGVVDFGPANALAIGTDPGVAYRWDGTAWRTASLPDASFAASSITAVSAADIWLVGSTSAGAVAEAMHFDGATWKVVPMPQPRTDTPLLNGVAAVAANDVWAVGYLRSAAGGADGTLTEHWNGSAWSIVPSPTPAGAYPMLNAVAARSSGDVYAVGSAQPSGDGVTQGLILRWNGTSWSQDSDPTGAEFSVLYAAAATPGATKEWAAGFVGSGTGTDQALVLGYSANP